MGAYIRLRRWQDSGWNRVVFFKSWDTVGGNGFFGPRVAPKTQQKQILTCHSADRAGTRGGKKHLGAPVFHRGDLDPRFFATVHRSYRRLGPPCRDVDQSRRCPADLIATARPAAPRWGRGSEMGGHCVVGDRCLLRARRSRRCSLVARIPYRQ